MYSSSVQDQINKARTIRDRRTWMVIGAGIIYSILAAIFPNNAFVSPVIVPLTLGIGIGLLMFGFSLTLDFEKNKKLILMESMLESKLDEINNKMHTQDSMNLLSNKIDEQNFHIQILELKNEINSLKEELRRNYS